MVPSIAQDFEKRNLAFFRTIHLYPAIIEAFHEYSDFSFEELMKGYEEDYSDRYYNLQHFANEDAKRLNIHPPEESFESHKHTGKSINV